MAETALRREESLGLALAVIGHAALLAFLVWQKPAAPLPPPERMTVTISDELAATSSAPNPQPEAAPDKGPVLGEASPPEPVAPPSPEPQVQPKVQPRPAPVPLKPAPAPPKPTPPAAKTQQPQPKQPPKPGKPGASAFDSAFSNGIPGARSTGKAAGTPAVATGQLKSSWTSLIGSKVRGPWNSCLVSGLEVEKLYIDVRFTLNVDGSIASIDDPVVNGITPANRAQAAPFKACAIRAIKLAAPFKGLPPEYYNDWKLRLLRLRKQ